MRSYGSLRGSRRFDVLFTRGARAQQGAVTVIGLKRDNDRPEVGLVVGRRVGNAVVRNRIRRRLRAALDRVGVCPGVDFVVLANRKATTADFEDLCDWLREALLRVEQTVGATAR